MKGHKYSHAMLDDLDNYDSAGACAVLDEPDNVNLSKLQDEELINRYREGCKAAFTELVHRYERELFNYLRHYTGDAELADDVFQNTFLQVYLKLDSFDSSLSFHSWLYTIATNQAIDKLRKKGRHPTVSLDNSVPGSTGENPSTFGSLLEGREPEPDEPLMVEERNQMVQGLIDKLPNEHQTVIRMACFQRLKYREIADELDIPIGTVKSRLHAAFAKLRKLYKQATCKEEAA